MATMYNCGGLNRTNEPGYDSYVRKGKWCRNGKWIAMPKDIIHNGRPAVQYGKEIVELQINSLSIKPGADDTRPNIPAAYTYKANPSARTAEPVTNEPEPINQETEPMKTELEPVMDQIDELVKAIAEGLKEAAPVVAAEPVRKADKKQLMIDLLKAELAAMKAELAAVRTSATVQAEPVRPDPAPIQESAPSAGPAPSASTNYVKRTNDRATYKQIAYLQGLTGRSWKEFADLTRGAASDMITELTTTQSAVA